MAIAFSKPSNCLSAVPTGVAVTPGTPIAAYCAAFRDRLLASADMLAWIVTVNGLETTAGHVKLNLSPIDLPDVRTKGPIVVIRWENFRGDTAGSPKTFVTSVDIVLDFTWAILDSAGAATTRDSDEFITEMDFIDKIINNLVSTIGITLDSTFGGHIRSFDAPNALQLDPDDEALVHHEIRFTIGFGMEED